jgi:hypothetical protein
MSLVEMRGHPALAGNPASREIKGRLADAGTVAAAAMPIAAVAAGIAAAGIAVAEKGADEEFQ